MARRGLNQEQRNYLTTRLRSIKDKLYHDYRESLYKQLPPDISPEEVLKAIKAGKAKLRKDAYTRSMLYVAFTVPGVAERAKAKKKADDLLHAFAEKLDQEHNKIMDQIILGDSSIAAGMLEKFAGMKLPVVPKKRAKKTAAKKKAKKAPPKK